MNTWSTTGGIPFYPGWSENGKCGDRRRGDRARPHHRGIEIGGRTSTNGAGHSRDSQYAQHRVLAFNVVKRGTVGVNGNTARCWGATASAISAWRAASSPITTVQTNTSAVSCSEYRRQVARRTKSKYDRLNVPTALSDVHGQLYGSVSSLKRMRCIEAAVA
jgi:hypothetical protein